MGTTRQNEISPERMSVEKRIPVIGLGLVGKICKI